MALLAQLAIIKNIKIPNSASSASFPSAGRHLSWSGKLASSVSHWLLQLGIKHLWCSLVYLQKCKKPCCFEHRIKQTARNSFFNTALWASSWPKHHFARLPLFQFFTEQFFTSFSSLSSNSSQKSDGIGPPKWLQLLPAPYETDCLDCLSSAGRIWWWSHWYAVEINAKRTFS